MNNDVQISGKRHYQKSVNGFNQLPDIFTKEDVLKSFHYDKIRAADKKIERLISCSFVERIKDGADKGKYRKLQNALL
jgi:predicted transcriptional regulator